MSTEWSYGLLGCFGDCRLCLVSFCVPCVQVGRNADYFGESCCRAGCLCFLCGCPYEFLVRNRLRHLRGIKGSMTSDLCYSTLCFPCALTQDAREIEQSKRAGLPSGDTTVTSTVVTTMSRE